MRRTTAPCAFAAHPSRRRVNAAPRDEAGVTRLPDSNVKELVTRRRIPAARSAPELCRQHVPRKKQRARGMPGALLAPIALRANRKYTQAEVTTGQAASRDIPRASGFNGFLRALPGVHDVLVTVIGAMQSIVANLAPAKGRQDHTTSPSASRAARQAAQPRPPHSNPTLVTIAKRPSCGIERASL
jgi:hypothetical protein